MSILLEWISLKDTLGTTPNDGYYLRCEETMDANMVVLVLLLATYRTICKNLGIIICAWNVKNTVAAAKMRQRQEIAICTLLKQGYFSCVPLWFLLYYDWFSRIFCPLLRSLFAGFRQDKNKENYEFPLKMTSGQISCKMALWYGTLEKCDKLSLH